MRRAAHGAKGVDKEISKFIKAHQPDHLDAAYQRSDLLEQRRKALKAGRTMSQDKTIFSELSTIDSTEKLAELGEITAKKDLLTLSWGWVIY